MTVEERVRRAYAIVRHENTIEHESAHLAAAMLLGRGASEASVIPRDDANGWVRLEPLEEYTPEAAWAVALIALVGALEVRTSGWPPIWPLTPIDGESTSEDEAQLAICCECLKLDREGFDALVLAAWRLMARDDFDRLAFAYQVAFRERGILNRELIEAIFDYMQNQEEPTCSISD